MITRPCIKLRTTPSHTPLVSPRIPCILSESSAKVKRSDFHSTSARRQTELPNHYETLDLPTNASAVEVKKQFYKLSKSHHPDLHPNDSSASQRFVKISEAYATLGSPEKRARYDRDFLRASGGGPASSTGATPRGSYSSASPAGGQPASGLSRRRTKFQGPPPSFYQTGGWGAHGAKREQAARNASHSNEAQGHSQSGPTGPAGTGPGGFAMGFDNDVPHFDQKGHYQTHSGIERSRHKTRRNQEPVNHMNVNSGSSMPFNFVVVCGMLGFIYTASLTIGSMESTEET